MPVSEPCGTQKESNTETEAILRLKTVVQDPLCSGEPPRGWETLWHKICLQRAKNLSAYFTLCIWNWSPQKWRSLFQWKGCLSHNTLKKKWKFSSPQRWHHSSVLNAGLYVCVGVFFFFSQTTLMLSKLSNSQTTEKILQNWESDLGILSQWCSDSVLTWGSTKQLFSSSSETSRETCGYVFAKMWDKGWDPL